MERTEQCKKSRVLAPQPWFSMNATSINFLNAFTKTSVRDHCLFVVDKNVRAIFNPAFFAERAFFLCALSNGPEKKPMEFEGSKRY